MEREYDTIMIYDDRTVYSRLTIIHELEKLFAGCKYVATFELAYNDLVIARLVNGTCFKIKMYTFKEYRKLLREVGNCIVCTPLAGLSSNGTSTQLTNVIEHWFKNKIGLDGQQEKSNKGDKNMKRRYNPMMIDDIAIDDNSSIYSRNMIETNFPVIDTDMNCNWAASPSNAIKEKLNAFFGRGIFNNPDVSSSALHIEKVIFNPKATIVFWSDHTKTIVKVGEDDKRDDEKGLAMAISKKFLGNKGNYYNEFRKWLK